MKKQFLIPLGWGEIMKKMEILIDKNIYKPGENVIGKVVLRTDQDIKVRNVRLEILGQEKASITVSRGKHSVTYTDIIA
jgi:uncharacterized protein YfaS (alpha-2-macroglobulin family)